MGRVHDDLLSLRHSSTGCATALGRNPSATNIYYQMNLLRLNQKQEGINSLATSTLFFLERLEVKHLFENYFF